jgi:hypothetical protein
MPNTKQLNQKLRRLLIDSPIQDPDTMLKTAAELIDQLDILPKSKQNKWRKWVQELQRSKGIDIHVLRSYTDYLPNKHKSNNIHTQVHSDEYEHIIKAKKMYRSRLKADQIFKIVRMIPGSFTIFPANIFQDNVHRTKIPCVKDMKKYLEQVFNSIHNLPSAVAALQPRDEKTAKIVNIFPQRKRKRKVKPKIKPTDLLNPPLIAQGKKQEEHCRHTEDYLTQNIYPTLPNKSLELYANQWKLSNKQTQDPDLNKLAKLCTSFVNKTVNIWAQFDGEYIDVANCNAVGDLFENMFFKKFKERLPSFKRGPLQASPDYWNNDIYAYEQKCFMCNPGFDVSNFDSFVNELQQEGGLLKKMFQTKYLVFGYNMVKGEGTATKFVITHFYLLNIWNIVGYNGQYPISVQNKKGHWYNIRPSDHKDWLSKEKTPMKFIDHLIHAIQKCPNKIIEQNRDDFISNIQKQWNDIAPFLLKCNQ